ncbi:MAG: NAD(P)H-dependent oxidoreductase [bacterium]|nr:NAD(P)H-dependent oxidoreductase [bacterium]
MKKILAFAGSNSSTSINHQLLEVLGKEVEVDFELVSLRDYEAPMFGVDLKNAEGVPNTMKLLHEKMKTADGLLVSVAEHNGSMAAVLKNTFDWLSMLEKKFFLNKPTVFLSTSPGPRGAASSLKHIVEIMPYRGADIVGHQSVPSFYETVKDGEIESEMKEKLTALIRTLEASLIQES